MPASISQAVSIASVAKESAFAGKTAKMLSPAVAARRPPHLWMIERMSCSTSSNGIGALRGTMAMVVKAPISTTITTASILVFVQHRSSKSMHLHREISSATRVPIQRHVQSRTESKPRALADLRDPAGARVECRCVRAFRHQQYIR